MPATSALTLRLTLPRTFLTLRLIATTATATTSAALATLALTLSLALTITTAPTATATTRQINRRDWTKRRAIHRAQEPALHGALLHAADVASIALGGAPLALIDRHRQRAPIRDDQRAAILALFGFFVQLLRSGRRTA